MVASAYEEVLRQWQTTHEGLRRRSPAEPRGTVTVVDEGPGGYRPTAPMLRLLKALQDSGQRVMDGTDLYACRRRRLIDHDGRITPDGENLLEDYLRRTDRG